MSSLTCDVKKKWSLREILVSSDYVATEQKEILALGAMTAVLAL